jgi:hypothetical protein
VELAEARLKIGPSIYETPKRNISSLFGHLSWECGSQEAKLLAYSSSTNTGIRNELGVDLPDFIFGII